MKTVAIISLSGLLSFSGLAQDINVTFTAVGAATTIDNVTALNQQKSQTVTFPGNATLVLKKVSGIPDFKEPGNRITVFPNPFSGESKVVVTINEPQKVHLRIQNMIGKVIAQTNQFLQPGANEFVFSINSSGIYTVGITTEHGFESCRIVSLAASGQENKLQYTGLTARVEDKPNSPENKSYLSGYSLDYADGDIIQYTCHSGVMTTILTDLPTISKNYEVEFAYCTDPDGRNYPGVKIGEQIWMAENLAWLPKVSPPTEGSDLVGFYYVYGYKGTDIAAAKATQEYASYGVLYNRLASMNGEKSSTTSPSGVRGICPQGWHLPSTAECTVLYHYLTDNGYGYGGSGNDFAKSLADKTHWETYSTPGTPGNDPASNNSTGFSGLPVGSRYSGKFGDMGKWATWWTCTSSFTWGIDHFLPYYLVSGGSAGDNGFTVRCLRDIPTVPCITTALPDSLTINSVILGGEVLFDSWSVVTERGICYGQTQNPTVEDSKVAMGSGQGKFSRKITGLAGNTTFHARAYAINGLGTAYGVPVTLTTANEGNSGTFTDSRDGRTYPWLKIGRQVWMTQNLDWLPTVSPPTTVSDTAKVFYVHSFSGSDVAAAKATSNYRTYGVLYNFPAAADRTEGSNLNPSGIQGACPPGWHLPSQEEWIELADYLTNHGYGFEGSGDDIARSLAARTNWKASDNSGTPGNNPAGNNSSGFTGLPGSFFANNKFYATSEYASWWSSYASPPPGTGANGRSIYYDNSTFYFLLGSMKQAYSIRCVRH